MCLINCLTISTFWSLHKGNLRPFHLLGEITPEDTSKKYLLESRKIESKIEQRKCLGPIARLQLDACLCYSEATAHLHSPLIIAHICTYMINKDTSWTNNHVNLFICTPRHGGSTEPALPMARRKLSWSVRKRRGTAQVSIHVHSWIIGLKGRTSYIRIFMQKTGSH